jgi:hypothetical protein
MPISTTGVTFGLAAGLTVKLGDDVAAGPGVAVAPHAGHRPSSPAVTNFWHPLQKMSLMMWSSLPDVGNKKRAGYAPCARHPAPSNSLRSEACPCWSVWLLV